MSIEINYIECQWSIILSFLSQAVATISKNKTSLNTSASVLRLRKSTYHKLYSGKSLWAPSRNSNKKKIKRITNYHSTLRTSPSLTMRNCKAKLNLSSSHIQWVTIHKYSNKVNYLTSAWAPSSTLILTKPHFSSLTPTMQSSLRLLSSLKVYRKVISLHLTWLTVDWLKLSRSSWNHKILYFLQFRPDLMTPSLLCVKALSKNVIWKILSCQVCKV
jgi:hypothetical protein